MANQAMSRIYIGTWHYLVSAYIILLTLIIDIRWYLICHHKFCFVLNAVFNNSYYSSWVFVTKDSRADIFIEKSVIIPRYNS